MGKGGAGFLPGCCLVSMLLEATSPEKEYNDRPWGIFLASDSRAGQLHASMSHPPMSWPCSYLLLAPPFLCSEAVGSDEP